ncbi:hypothetical protein JS82_05175 [Methanomassiliicoccaceae archaeon DOK]|nr:hypothetical protein JS82_05175 [Methanomassiliicoccaceae archaeon DOK]
MTRTDAEIDRDLDRLWTDTRDIRHRMTRELASPIRAELVSAVSLCVCVCALIISLVGVIA